MSHALAPSATNPHQQAVRMTYGLLLAGFALMISINLAAYWMFMLINDHYRRQDQALVNCKLEATNAHMLFQEVKSGVSGVDLNEVWKKLIKAKQYAELVAGHGVGSDLPDRLEAYRQALLSTNVVITREAIEGPPPVPVPGPDTLDQPPAATPPRVTATTQWEATCHIYGELMKGLDDVEGTFRARTAARLGVVRILYGVLFLVMLALFGVLLHSLRAYIHERRAAEELLTESRDCLRTIFDALDSLVLVAGPQGEIQHCNLAAAKYFGWKRERIKGEILWQRVPWLAPYAQALAKVFYSGQPLDLRRERVAIGTTERVFNLGFHAAPSLAGVILRADDVTMEAVQDAHARQTQQMHLLRNLMRSLANDFNNALGALGGTLSLMRFSMSERERADESLADHFTTMEAALERAAMMVRQMSAIAGEPDAQLRPMDLVERLRHILNVLRNNLPQGVHLRVELPKGRALIGGHDRLLEQIMINLMDNAVAALAEARAAGGGQGGPGLLTVQLDQVMPDQAFRNRQPQATANGYFVVHVGDTGPGMLPEVVSRIFDPFFTTRAVTRSAGLGLSLVNEAVTTLGGFIEVRSVPGQGSVFSIYLPELADATEFLAREAQVAEAAENAEAIPLGTGSVLVVDDEAVMRKTAANLLAKLGYAVEVAEGGRQALELFRQRHGEFSLVVLDLAMPEMGGKETFLALREINPAVRVLMASGYQRGELINEALQLGIAGFIRKPYRLSTLAQEIDRIVRMSAQEIARQQDDKEAQVAPPAPKDPDRDGTVDLSRTKPFLPKAARPPAADDDTPVISKTNPILPR